MLIQLTRSLDAAAPRHAPPRSLYPSPTNSIRAPPHCVLGPRQLHDGDDYIVSLLSPEEVRDVAKALDPVTAEWFEERYSTVVPKDHAPEYGQDDLDYTWSNIQAVKALFQKAAGSGRAVIFTVDQ